MTTLAYIAIGANIHPEKNILKALLLLSEYVELDDISMIYRTAPLHQKKQPHFLNGVCRIFTDQEPGTLKNNILRGIEKKMGRIRTEDINASRPIDLDIIIFGERIIHEQDLIIPDPDIYSRPFLAFPLLELEPNLVVPGDRKSLREQINGLTFSSMRAEPEFTEKLKERLHL